MNQVEQSLIPPKFSPCLAGTAASSTCVEGSNSHQHAAASRVKPPVLKTLFGESSARQPWSSCWSAFGSELQLAERELIGIFEEFAQELETRCV